MRGIHNMLYHRKQIREKIQLNADHIEFDETINSIDSKSNLEVNSLLPLESRDLFKIISSNLESK